MHGPTNTITRGKNSTYRQVINVQSAQLRLNPRQH